MTGEEIRQALEAQGQTTGGPSADAYAEREARKQHDIDLMKAGPVQHAYEMTSHHEGQPSVAVQQKTHGAPAPRLPDTGGRG